jgi:hypothetical protein
MTMSSGLSRNVAVIAPRDEPDVDTPSILFDVPRFGEAFGSSRGAVMGTFSDAVRSSALTSVCGMSICETESPNSYSFVDCNSTAPSPMTGP